MEVIQIKVIDRLLLLTKEIIIIKAMEIIQIILDILSKIRITIIMLCILIRIRIKINNNSK